MLEFLQDIWHSKATQTLTWVVLPLVWGLGVEFIFKLIRNRSKPLAPSQRTADSKAHDRVI